MMKPRPSKSFLENEETQAPDRADDSACADLDKHTEGGGGTKSVRFSEPVTEEGSALTEEPLKWWVPLLGEAEAFAVECEAQYFASGRRRTLQEDPTLRFDELETVVAEEADSPDVIEWRKHMFSGKGFLLFIFIGTPNFMIINWVPCLFYKKYRWRRKWVNTCTIWVSW